MNYVFHMVVLLCIYGIAAMGLGVVVGYCGLISFGHAAYFAIGAYTYSLSTLNGNLGFVPGVVLAGVVTLAASPLLSIPSWRLKGDNFVFLSIAVQSVIYNVAMNWYNPSAPVGSLTNLTGGPLGIAGIPKPSILSFHADSPAEVAAFAVCVAAICFALGAYCLSSPWGRLLKSMRDDEHALVGLGKNVRRLRSEALALSCLFAGIAGALYSSFLGYVDPSSAGMDESLLVLSMVLIGGVGNCAGPVLGAAMIIILPECLKAVGLNDTLAAHVRLIAYGGALVLLVHFRPRGLRGAYDVGRTP